MSTGVSRGVEIRATAGHEGSISMTPSRYEDSPDVETRIHGEVLGLASDLNDLDQAIMLLTKRLKPILNSSDANTAQMKRGVLTSDESSDHHKDIMQMRNRVMGLTDDISNIFDHLDI